MTKTERCERIGAAHAAFAQAIRENVGPLVGGSGVCERKPTRESSLALTNAEQAKLWACAGIVAE